MKLGFSQEEIRNTVRSLELPDHPFYMRRTARALDIVNQDKVHSLSDDSFRVDSQFDDKHYHVELNHGNPGCTCPDHQKNTGAMCKHMIASMLFGQKQAKPLQVKKVSNNSPYITGRWLIIDGNGIRHVVYKERNGKTFCTCKKHYKDCEHKKAIRDHNGGGGGGNGSKPTNECGSERAKALQEKMNGQLDSSKNNGNGADKAPSQPTQLDITDPFQQSEQLDIDQIEGRSNGELVHRLSNGKFVISYKGIMKLSFKHHITFETAKHSETSTVIAQGRCGRNERASGKPINGNANTAIELAKRNAARQLLPLAEIKAMEKKAQLEAMFDWQEAEKKCVQLVGTEANVDITIYHLVKAGKLRQENPSGYNRTEWLLIHNACKEDAQSNDDNNEGEVNASPSPTLDTKSLNRWSFNSPEVREQCKQAIAEVRERKSKRKKVDNVSYRRKQLTKRFDEKPLEFEVDTTKPNWVAFFFSNGTVAKVYDQTIYESVLRA